MKFTKRFYSQCAVGLIVLLVVWACGSKHQQPHDEEHASGHHDATAWKEMDDFHAVMRDTFHPYKDSTNLEPVKKRASELMTAADEWASAELPGKVNNAEVKAKLRQLRSEAGTLAESVKSSDDNVIGEHLTRLHDTFHEIQEAWYEGQ